VAKRGALPLVGGRGLPAGWHRELLLAWMPPAVGPRMMKEGTLLDVKERQAMTSPGVTVATA
jgi:hypothetical protein